MDLRGFLLGKWMKRNHYGWKNKAMNTREITNLTIEEKFEVTISLIFLGVGLFCLFFPQISADSIMISAAILTSASAVLLLYQAIRYHRTMDLLKALAAGILAGVFWSWRAEGVRIVCLVFAIYIFAISVIVALEGVLDLREKSKTGWSFILFGLGDFLICLFALLLYTRDPSLVQRLSGVYLVWQAIQMFVELYVFHHHKGSRAWSFRRWSSLPVYLVAVGPSLVLRYARKKNLSKKAFTSVANKNDDPVNLRVFIHSGLKGDKQFGHMTFSYKGVMFSYGNYDQEDEKLFRTFGPGILFTAPADIYVNNSCVYENSILFEYGLHLTSEQEEHLVSLLKDVFKPAYRWYSPLFQGPVTKERFKTYESDYASRLEWRTGAKFYKFRTGIWKTYWVLGRNCSLFASDLLHQIDSSIVIPRGINTPGEYFEYFEEAIQDPDSNVICQSWHSASDPDTLYPAAL